MSPMLCRTELRVQTKRERVITKNGYFLLSLIKGHVFFANSKMAKNNHLQLAISIAPAIPNRPAIMKNSVDPENRPASKNINVITTNILILLSNFLKYQFIKYIVGTISSMSQSKTWQIFATALSVGNLCLLRYLLIVAFVNPASYAKSD